MEGYLSWYDSYTIFCKKYPAPHGYWRYEVWVKADDILRKRNKVHVAAEGEPLAESGIFFSGEYDTSTGKITYKSYYKSMTKLNPAYGYYIPPEDELLDYFINKVKEFMNKIKDPKVFNKFKEKVLEGRRKETWRKSPKKAQKKKEEKEKEEKEDHITEPQSKASILPLIAIGGIIVYLLIRKR